jgi:microcystin-dependent protein
MSEPFLGQIQMFGFNFAPRSWAFCDGQLLAVAQNTALFSLLGTAFGGDGRTTFALPDLRGRSAMHPGSGPGLPTYTWGQRGGQHETSQVAAHTHNFAQPAKNDAAADETNPAGATFGVTGAETYFSGAANSAMAGGTTASTGLTAVSIQNPFLGVYHSIALQGIFPSRS